MKKFFTGFMLYCCSLGLALPAFADDGTTSSQQLDGSTQGNVEVNGTLGADNTDPTATIPEGDENWVNVTLPTKTIFYNTANSPAIKSPNYSIVNQSGRPVKVSLYSLENATGNATLELPDDYELKLCWYDKAVSTETPLQLLIADKNKTNFDKETYLTTLANKNGKMEEGDTANTALKETTFSFSGSASATTQIQPKYTITLKFEAIVWK
jgi:hypothetical protein